MLSEYIAKVCVKALNCRLQSCAPVLTWLTQRVPESDMVLIHDDDLARIHELCNSNVSVKSPLPKFDLYLTYLRSQEALQSDTIIHLLRKYQPNIQVLCGEELQLEALRYLWLLMILK